MTHITSKLIRSSHYAALSAAFLLQAHSAFANDAIGDAQAQARALLDPPVLTGAKIRVSTQPNDQSAAHPDAQALARALLLGRSNESGASQAAIVRHAKAPGTGSSSEQGRRAYANPEEAARRMILGSRAPAVSSTTITVSGR
jgi:hypothetical protein